MGAGSLLLEPTTGNSTVGGEAAARTNMIAHTKSKLRLCLVKLSDNDSSIGSLAICSPSSIIVAHRPRSENDTVMRGGTSEHLCADYPVGWAGRDWAAQADDCRIASRLVHGYTRVDV